MFLSMIRVVFTFFLGEKMIVKNESNSQHWYDKDGKPCYTIIGKNGKERNTTVRDAREHGYLPSVTTIISQLDKPALTRWKMEQMLLASLTLPRLENEPEVDYIARVVEDSRSTGKDAMTRGTEMHNLLELFYSGVYMLEYPQFVLRTEKAISEYFGEQDWKCEESFAFKGYAGKCDLHANGIVIDFKTKTDSLDKATVYAEHIMQLAAYREGFGMPNARCAIVFVSDTETKICEIKEEDLNLAYKKFTLLKDYFYLEKGL
jgi:hypothetical protein